MPPLVLGAVYGLIFAFTSGNNYSKWSSLLGSATYFGCMSLLAEYVVVAIVAFLTFRCTKNRLISAQESSQSGLARGPEAKASLKPVLVARGTAGD
jgi:hypothetical protein